MARIFPEDAKARKKRRSGGETEATTTTENDSDAVARPRPSSAPLRGNNAIKISDLKGLSDREKLAKLRQLNGSRPITAALLVQPPRLAPDPRDPGEDVDSFLGKIDFDLTPKLSKRQQAEKQMKDSLYEMENTMVNGPNVPIAPLAPAFSLRFPFTCADTLSVVSVNGVLASFAKTGRLSRRSIRRVRRIVAPCATSC